MYFTVATGKFCSGAFEVTYTIRLISFLSFAANPIGNKCASHFYLFTRSSKCGMNLDPDAKVLILKDHFWTFTSR